MMLGRRKRSGDYLRQAELEAVFLRMYGPLYRMAHALSPQPTVAEQVVWFVLNRAALIARRWRSEEDAQRWFLHHTVLAARRFGGEAVEIRLDPLVLAGPAGDPGYAALVAAIRGLPPQQREAVILNLGAHLNERFLALAMDCSVGAAEAHLQAGLAQLKAVIGDPLASLAAELGRAYAALGPIEESTAPLRRAVQRLKWRGRAARWLRWGAIAAAIVAAIIGWRWVVSS